MFNQIADAVFGEMDDRGLLNGVGEDLFDEIKDAVTRTALEAMRVPTEAMCNSAASKPGQLTYADVYTAMIDSLIGERAK